MNRAIVSLFAILLIMIVPLSRGEDWPQFRGPTGQGHAQAHDLPRTWSESENVTWKVAIPGKGWSSPVIQGDEIWLTTAVDDGHALHAVALQASTGRILKDVKVFDVADPPSINAKNSYASPTPVLTPGRVYVHYGTFGTACIDRKSGQVIWSTRDLKLDHKEGPGSSPIVYNGLFIVHCDGIDLQYVAALDAETGKPVWRSERPGPLSDSTDQRKAYCTPLVIQVDGRDQMISVAADHAYALDPKNGERLWWVNYTGYSNVPRPIFGHGLVYICTGYNNPELWAIRPDGKGDVTDTHVVWRMKRQVPANPSPILVDDLLYMVSDKGVLTCLDAVNGEELWRQRLSGGFSASPVYADGVLYFSSEEGVVEVITPGRSYQSAATNALDGALMASPAIVGQTIFLRTDTHLYRIEKPTVRAATGS